MNEEITKKVQEIYDNLIYFPNKVLSIFNDFFGEDRVDLQDLPTYEELVNILEEKPFGWFFESKSNVYNTPEFNNLSIENKDRIVKLLDSDIFSKPILSDETTALFLLSVMTSTIIRKLSSVNSILIHFPNVRITNEHDRFVDITHLWVKVKIKTNGSSTGFFTMNRSEYPVTHIQADYMHSHCPGIPVDDFHFVSPCLGTGPIKTTLTTLAMGYDEAMWQLFCLELDKYVRVESIEGVPYRYLEKINDKENLKLENNRFSPIMVKLSSSPTKLVIKSFIKHLIESKKLKFNFINGSYGFAMSYINFRILISNEFISWYNLKFNEGKLSISYRTLISEGIITEIIIDDNKIYDIRNGRTRRNYSDFEGKLVCTFKGNPITVHIIEDTTECNLNKSTLLGARVVDHIAKVILEVVNYKYGREEERGEEVGVNTPTIYL